MPNDPQSSQPESLLADSTWMRALARRLVRDPGSAEDVVQDTWVAALQRPWPAGRPPRPWLARAMRNVLRSRTRRERRRSRRERAGARPEAEPSAEELALRVEAQKLLAEALMRLEEPLRSCLILRYAEGLRPTEIAASRGVPLGTIHSRLKRGLDRLREDLDRRFGGERGVWAGIFLPLARARSTHVERAARASLAAGTGAWIMKNKLAYLAVAGLLGLLGVGLWSARAGPGAGSLRAVGGGGEDRLLDSRVRAGTRIRAGSTDTEERVSMGPGETPAGDAALPRPTAPGWWLVGQVTGIDGADVGGETTVRVEGLWSFHSDWVPVETVVEEILVGAANGFELEISDLFLEERRLLHQLRVTIAHPGHTTFEQLLPLDGSLRQRGYLPTRNVIFEVRAELLPVPAVLEGRLILPDGVDAELVSVALVPSDHRGKPAEDGWVVTHPDEAGDYRLEVQELGDHRVVAYVATSRMVEGDQLAECRSDLQYPVHGVEPAFQSVAVEAGGGMVETMTLSAGRILEGRVLLGDGPPGVALSVSAYHEWPARVTLVGPDKVLRWTDDGFEYAVLSTVTDEQGNFRISGLHAKPLELRLGSVVRDGQPVWTGSPGGRYPERVTLEEPATGVELRWNAGLFLGLLEESAPRARYYLGKADHEPRTAYEVGAGRRVAFLFPAGAGYGLQFLRPGLSSERFPLELGVVRPGEWVPIRFGPDEVTSSMRLHLHGDPQREAEFFQVWLRPAHDPGATLDDREGTGSLYAFWRNAGAQYSLSTLRPGRFDVLVEPLRQREMDEHGDWVTREMTLADEYYRVELRAGEVVDLDVFLRTSGRLEIRTVREAGIEGGTARYRLFDAQGSPVRVTSEFEGQLDLGETHETSVRRLAPGSYELVLTVDSAGTDTVSSFPVEIHAGETTVVEVP